MFKQEIFDEYKKIGFLTNDASAEFDMILDYLEIDSLKELKGENFSEKEKSEILKIVKERVSTKKPLQYILGFAYFMGEKFLVDENTLIPRPETEILVQECVKLINKDSKILDIGTGSGCIAIELNKLTKSCPDAVDISEKALNIAEKNAELHHAGCNFFLSDLFLNVVQKYDLIVSNPPYIPYSQKCTLDETVKSFEPHASLFTNDEFGLEYYEKIINNCETFLNKNGYVAFETGQNQAQKVVKIFKNKGFKLVKTVKDLDSIERVVIAKKN